MLELTFQKFQQIWHWCLVKIMLPAYSCCLKSDSTWHDTSALGNSLLHRENSILPMTGFELRTSRVGSGRSTNCAWTINHKWLLQQSYARIRFVRSGVAIAQWPTILPPRVWVPSTPSTLLSFTVFVLYLSCEKNENKQKEAGFGPFFKKKIFIRMSLQISGTLPK